MQPDPRVRGRLPRAKLLPRWRAVAVALAAAALLHALVLDRVHEAIQPLDLQTSTMQRLQASYTRTVAPAEPVAAAAPPARPKPRRPAARAVAAAASAAASSPTETAKAAATEAAQAASAAGAAASAALAEVASAAAALSAAASAATPAGGLAPMGAASGAMAALAGAANAVLAGAQPAASAALPTFRWPASTRLSYRLNGWYNGEVLGQAQVEWLRQGERYQVHLDVSIGPSFAPLVHRRMSSEGLITPAGLVPQRYEQETTQVIGRNRHAQMRFDDTGIVLARGERVPTFADVQDTASQFIQIIYLLTTQPMLSQPGQAIEFGLALPNRVDRWVYEVRERVAVDTPVGMIMALHVQPRRRAEGGNLTAQMWYAPSLQMLPVRIRIEQDANVWVDLKLERAPEQSGP